MIFIKVLHIDKDNLSQVFESVNKFLIVREVLYGLHWNWFSENLISLIFCMKSWKKYSTILLM